MLTTD